MGGGTGGAGGAGGEGGGGGGRGAGGRGLGVKCEMDFDTRRVDISVVPRALADPPPPPVNSGENRGAFTHTYYNGLYSSKVDVYTLISLRFISAN